MLTGENARALAKMRANVLSYVRRYERLQVSASEFELATVRQRLYVTMRAGASV